MKKICVTSVVSLLIAFVLVFAGLRWKKLVPPEKTILPEK